MKGLLGTWHFPCFHHISPCSDITPSWHTKLTPWRMDACRIVSANVILDYHAFTLRRDVCHHRRTVLQFREANLPSFSDPLMHSYGFANLHVATSRGKQSRSNFVEYRFFFLARRYSIIITKNSSIKITKGQIFPFALRN